MNKFNVYLYILIALFILVSIPVPVFAKRSLTYYQSVLEKNDIKTVSLDSDSLMDIANTSVQPKYVKENILVDSSDFLYLNTYLDVSYSGNIFVLCTSKLVINDHIFCDENSIYLDSKILEESIFSTTISNITYYLIPEVYFSHPSKYDALKDSLRVINKSFTKEEMPVNNLQLPYLFRYIFLLFLLIIFLYAFFIKYKSFKLGLSVFFHKLIVWLIYFRNPNLYILFLVILIYPFILSAISFSDTGAFDFQYMYNFVLDTFSVVGFFRFIEQRSFVKIIMFLVNYFVFLTTAITLIPVIFEYRKIFLQNSIFSNIKQIKYSYIWYSISFILLVILLTSNTFSSYPFLFSIVWLMFSYIYIFDNTLYLLHRDIKLSLLGGMCVFLLLLGMLAFLSPKEKSSLLQIFPVDDASIFLPVKISTEDLRLYSSSYIYSNAPLIADLYPLYFPNYSSIFISSIKHVSSTTSDIIILADNIKNYAEFLISTPSLANYAKSSFFDSLILLKYENLDTENLYMYAKFDCSKGLEPTSVNMRFYELAEKIRNVKVLNLPGCNDGFLEYTFPLIFTPKNTGYILLQIENIHPSVLPSVVIYDRNYIKNPNYIFVKNPESNKVIYDNTSSIKTSNPLHAFIFRDISPITLDSNKDTKYFEISNTLNHLILNGYLEDDFYIWSVEPDAIIKVVYNWFYL